MTKLLNWLDMLIAKNKRLERAALIEYRKRFTLNSESETHDSD